MKKAVIFDLDGTLIDSIEAISFNANLALIKNNLSTINTGTYRFMVGDGAKALVARMLTHIKHCDDLDLFHKVLDDYVTEYDKNCLKRTIPYKGIVAMLRQLKENGIKLGVLTNKPHSSALQIIDAFFPDLFDICLGARQDVPLKPDPTSLLEMIKELDFEPCECAYVGDMPVDILTAQNANVFSIGVIWGFCRSGDLLEYRPGGILDSPKNILKLLED